MVLACKFAERLADFIGRGGLLYTENAVIVFVFGLGGHVSAVSSFQLCHPERNFVVGEADDKVESKDPMFVDTTPGNARRSRRAVIAWVAHSLRHHRKGGNHTDRTMGFAFHRRACPK